MNPLTQELGKAPLAPPKPRTGVLAREIVHNTKDDDRELESKKKWGYFQLTGEVSMQVNPDSAPCKPYFLRFYPFVCTRTRGYGNGDFDFHYRACAVVAYVDPYDCEIGDFYKRFEFTREHTMDIPMGRDGFMRFEKKLYRMPAHPNSQSPFDYDEIELWERVS